MSGVFPVGPSEGEGGARGDGQGVSRGGVGREGAGHGRGGGGGVRDGHGGEGRSESAFVLMTVEEVSEVSGE